MRAGLSVRRILVGGSMACLLFAATFAVADSLAKSNSVPGMKPPEYLAQTVDPASGATFVRVTEPLASLGAGLVCKRSYCTHRYSSAQAWNADQSLLLIVNGCDGLCFLDGQTYLPLFKRRRGDDCEWHPANATAMICVGGNRISLWIPRSNAEETVFVAESYRNLRFGPNKGNPSHDGRRIAVRATAGDGSLVAFVVDIAARRKFADIPLAQLPGSNSYCGISPLGLHVFCKQTAVDLTDQSFIFDIDGKLIQSWTEHHRPGHGDMTIDADGSEVYVGISKAAPDKYQVIKRRLKDGTVMPLTPPGNAQHAVTRAIHRPGWVFLSYAGDANPANKPTRTATFAREVIALRIDGSGEFRRIAHTFNAPYDYWSETHASPSPDGSQVIWSSNWDRPGGPVFDFVSRVLWNERD